MSIIKIKDINQYALYSLIMMDANNHGSQLQ